MEIRLRAWQVLALSELQMRWPVGPNSGRLSPPSAFSSTRLSPLCCTPVASVLSQAAMRSQTVVLPLQFSYKSVDTIGASSLLSSLMSYDLGDLRSGLNVVESQLCLIRTFVIYYCWFLVKIHCCHLHNWQDKIAKHAGIKVFRGVRLSIPAWLTSQRRSGRGQRRFTFGFTLLTEHTSVVCVESTMLHVSGV